ncbi:MAG TPA: fused MFS/spermidine synthase, partial [Asanoa sp.]
MAEPRPLPGGLAAFLAFFASGSVLVLETVSLRLVGPYVGVTLQVTSSVIGVALAAIAYGAWLGGTLADRANPRRFLGPALILAGVATGLTLPITRYAGELLRGGAVSAILLLTSLAVFVPALLLSAIPPLVVKL